MTTAQHNQDLCFESWELGEMCTCKCGCSGCLINHWGDGTQSTTEISNK